MPITSQYFAAFNKGNLGNLWHMEMYKAHWEDPTKIDQWPLSDIIDTQERFCHNVRNFIDYLLKSRMFYCSCWGHAFDRAIDLKKLRVKGRISPRWQFQKPPTPFLHTKTPKEDVHLIYQESIQKLLQFNLNLCSNNLFRLIQEWSDEYLIGAQECQWQQSQKDSHQRPTWCNDFWVQSECKRSTIKFLLAMPFHGKISCMHPYTHWLKPCISQEWFQRLTLQVQNLM